MILGRLCWRGSERDCRAHICPNEPTRQVQNQRARCESTLTPQFSTTLFTVFVMCFSNTFLTFIMCLETILWIVFTQTLILKSFFIPQGKIVTTLKAYKIWTVSKLTTVKVFFYHVKLSEITQTWLLWLRLYNKKSWGVDLLSSGIFITQNQKTNRRHRRTTTQRWERTSSDITHMMNVEMESLHSLWTELLWHWKHQIMSWSCVNKHSATLHSETQGTIYLFN